MSITEFIDLDEARKNRERIEFAHKAAPKISKRDSQELRTPRQHNPRENKPKIHLEKTIPKIPEVIRLHRQKLSAKVIAKRCNMSVHTVESLISEYEAKSS